MDLSDFIFHSSKALARRIPPMNWEAVMDSRPRKEHWEFHSLRFFLLDLVDWKTGKVASGYYGCCCEIYRQEGKCFLAERPSMLNDFDAYWHWLRMKHGVIPDSQTLIRERT